MDGRLDAGVTIVGLGPGNWESLTLEAAEVLRSAREVYVRTAHHPAIQPIVDRLPEVRFHSFDSLYKTLPTLDEVYTTIVREIADRADGPNGVVYAVPGSLSLGETTVRMLLQTVRPERVRMVQGISFVEPVLIAVGVTDASWLQVVDAAEADRFARESPLGELKDDDERLPWRAPVPTEPMLVSHLVDGQIASGVELWLSRYYPAGHTVRLIRGPGTPGCETLSFPLRELNRQRDLNHHAALYVPPLSERDNIRTFTGLMNLTRTLRAPGGCPWDREQTHATLKPHLLEETYEVLDALDSGDSEGLCEELGDLLFQVAIHSQVAAESGAFTVEDVLGNVVAKLIGRHPHVFGELQLDSAQDVRLAWESFKQREKPKRSSVLEQIPKGLPALPQSNLLQKRAASVGFEWSGIHDVISKVEEELAELRHEVDVDAPKEQQREEFGDILFALVSVGRHLRIDPEEALRLANRKFAARFQYVESRVAGDGKALREVSAAQLDAYWKEAKALGTGIATD